MIIPKSVAQDRAMGESRFMKLETPVDNITGLMYVNIPKNASCWAVHHFMPADPYNYYEQKFDPDHNLCLVILRDPISRWISGMGQFLVGHNPPSKWYIDTCNWDEVTDQMVFDDHTQAQCDFIANIPEKSIVWFKCDSLLKNNFVDFLSKYNVKIDLLDEADDCDNIFNVTKKVQSRLITQINYQAPPQQEIVDKINRKLNDNPRYIEKIKEFYKKDFELYNSVPYYVAR